MSPGLEHNLENASKDIARNLAQMLEAIKQGDMRQAKAFAAGLPGRLLSAASYSTPGGAERAEIEAWFRERFKDL